MLPRALRLTYLHGLHLPSLQSAEARDGFDGLKTLFLCLHWPDTDTTACPAQCSIQSTFCKVTL